MNPNEEQTTTEHSDPHEQEYTHYLLLQQIHYDEDVMPTAGYANAPDGPTGNGNGGRGELSNKRRLGLSYCRSTGSWKEH